MCLSFVISAYTSDENQHLTDEIRRTNIWPLVFIVKLKE